MLKSLFMRLFQYPLYEYFIKLSSIPNKFVFSFVEYLYGPYAIHMYVHNS